VETGGDRPRSHRREPRGSRDGTRRGIAAGSTKRPGAGNELAEALPARRVAAGHGAHLPAGSGEGGGEGQADRATAHDPDDGPAVVRGRDVRWACARGAARRRGGAPRESSDGSADECGPVVPGAVAGSSAPPAPPSCAAAWRSSSSVAGSPGAPGGVASLPGSHVSSAARDAGAGLGCDGGVLFGRDSVAPGAAPAPPRPERGTRAEPATRSRPRQPRPGPPGLRPLTRWRTGSTWPTAPVTLKILLENVLRHAGRRS